jgi:nitroimidazol reductase NimA-like FMN-containing flavoprotein (pyridoxamine 5'-phosphate oxidase superfamily)
MNNKSTVIHIIETSTYLTLATTDGENPWANAVFFAADKDFNLYFTSYNNSQHVKNILKNPNVSVAIFDSHIVPGTGA